MPLTTQIRGDPLVGVALPGRNNRRNDQRRLLLKDMLDRLDLEVNDAFRLLSVGNFDNPLRPLFVTNQPGKITFAVQCSEAPFQSLQFPDQRFYL